MLCTNCVSSMPFELLLMQPPACPAAQQLYLHSSYLSRPSFCKHPDGYQTQKSINACTMPGLAGCLCPQQWTYRRLHHPIQQCQEYFIRSPESQLFSGRWCSFKYLEDTAFPPGVMLFNLLRSELCARSIFICRIASALSDPSSILWVATFSINCF